MTPVPEDFAPNFVTVGGALKWSQSVQIGDGREQIVLEIGYPIHGHDVAELRSRLRIEAWALLENAKGGHIDLIRHARRDRHQGHPVSSPTG